MLKRPDYLNNLISYKDTELIKVITGIRRCGKSTLLELYRLWLLENGVAPAQIQSINFEDVNYSYLTNHRTLHEHILQNCVPNKKNYILLDEIQNVEKFQTAVDSLFIRKNIDIYITGSNARLLSGELATLLSGRYIEIHILPLSFQEYLSAFDNKYELSKKYNDYIINSSFPYSLKLRDDPNQIRDYLGGIYNTIVLKDVIERKKVADAALLKRVIRFMFDNIGNLCSNKKIADTLVSSGRQISTNTVDSYLSALTDSYILYRVGRYNVRGKEYLKTGHKYYLADIGLRFYLLGSAISDPGRILENVVYLELLRRRWEIYIGKIDNYEVDFVVQKGGQREYYQVALTVRDKTTLEREQRSLCAIKDNYPKFILTMDDDPPANDDGIQRLNVLDWLADYGQRTI
ncbi:MAG: ATP-binding protein [Treponema sp.]|jgi:predicted AAA+ superfamily ATPase|nr:ATP-binding protein [Treponema sp.]